MARTTEDAVLGGRLVLRQPQRGHRVGHDAILLAAATSVRSGEHAVDLGAGIGAAGLALARRVDGARVTLVEIDPALAALGGDNAERNGLAATVRSVCLDVAAPAGAFAAAGLAAGSADRVLMNPPFNPPDNPSPDRRRRLAHAAAAGSLAAWMRTARRLLRSAGTLTLIWRADGLADLVASLGPDFGAATLLPLHAKAGAPAIRVILRAVKGSRAPLVLLRGFVLVGEDGKPSEEAEAVLRRGQILPLAED